MRDTFPGSEPPSSRPSSKPGKRLYRKQLGVRLNAASALSSRVGRFFSEVFPGEDKLTPQVPPQDLLLRISLLLRPEGALAGLPAL